MPQSQPDPAREIRSANPAALGLVPLARRSADRRPAAWQTIRPPSARCKLPPANEWVRRRTEPRRHLLPTRRQSSLPAALTIVTYLRRLPPFRQFQLSISASRVTQESPDGPA